MKDAGILSAKRLRTVTQYEVTGTDLDRDRS
jgi:hypothetical protein